MDSITTNGGRRDIKELDIGQFLYDINTDLVMALELLKGLQNCAFNQFDFDGTIVDHTDFDTGKIEKRIRIAGAWAGQFYSIIDWSLVFAQEKIEKITEKLGPYV